MLCSRRRDGFRPQRLRPSFVSPVLLLALAVLLGAGAHETAARELVQYPDERVAFIIGPQVRSGTDPAAAWFDEVSPRRARYWAERMLSKDWNNSTAITTDDLSVADNHYDLALCLYVGYYRTGDPELLTLARRVADRWWDSVYLRGGSEFVPGGYQPSPIYQAFAGLMLRALDGRPEMWGRLDSKIRAEFDVWIKPRVGNPTLYSDLRDLGYVQLYAVLLAKVLPDSYTLYANGTNLPATGQVTNGAARRAAYLADAEHAAVNYFGRLQQADGSWRWDLWDGSRRNFEQPFMLGIYFESVAALHQLTERPDVKASLVAQLTKGCEHLYRDTYVKEVVPGLTSNTRVTLYFYTREHNTEPANSDRHLTTSNIHAFGYAYKVTGDAKFKTWGDDLWDSAFGGSDGQRALLDSTYHPKEYTMEVRSAPRYLAWSTDATPPSTPTPTPTPTPTTTPAPQPSLVSPGLVAAARVRAAALASAAAAVSAAEISALSDEIERARQTFAAESGGFAAAAEIDTGLRAALYFGRAATALSDAQAPVGTVGGRLAVAEQRLKLAEDLMTGRAASPSAFGAAAAPPASIIGTPDARSSASQAQTLAPFSLATIAGDRLPYELGGASVSISGRAAQLLYASPSRVEFVVPAELGAGEHELIVTAREGLVSRGVVAVADVLPGLFAAGGTDEALAMNAVTSTRGGFDVTTPQALGADKRTRVSLFATGIFNVRNSDAANDVREGDRTYANVAESVVLEARTSDGRAFWLPVEFAGSSRALPGLDQLVFRLIPELSGAGAVRLTLWANARESNRVVITVR
jgi:uncharacterized protein (TIGR03437 family)